MTFDWLTLRLLALVATALMAGGMVFFSFIFAPLVFAKLPRPDAGRFIREVFPVYHLAVGVAGIVALAALAASPSRHAVEFIVITAVAVAAIFARRVILPRAGALRDRAEAGDADAGARFHRLHGASTVLNLAQLAAVLFVLVRLGT